MDKKGPRLDRTITNIKLFSDGYWAFYEFLEDNWLYIPDEKIPKYRINWRKGYEQARKDYTEDVAKSFFQALDKFYKKYKAEMVYTGCDINYLIEINNKKYLIGD